MKTLCIAGKNNIACDILMIALERLEKNQIVVIPNAADDGIDTWQRSFLKLAREHQVEIVTLKDVYQMQDVVFLSLEFDKIVATKKFRQGRFYNIHFSLLPKYKGMYTAYWPIICGEEKTGVTLHVIDDGIDTGAIIAQSEYEITEHMTCRDLYLNNISYGTRLVETFFDQIVSGEIEAHEQPSAQATYYSKQSVSFQNNSINMNQTAFMIRNQIRALRFREYQLATFQDISVSHGVITDKRIYEKPGTVIEEDEYAYLVATIDYGIYLYKDRLEEIVRARKVGDIAFLEACAKRDYNIEEEDGRSSHD